jgi:2-polyprenyl-3-methyl-5-hydroxy-6-metoxy-1,4-benzoquinol methylase
MIREAIIQELITNKDVLDIGSLGQTGTYSLWKDVYGKSGLKSLTGIDLDDAIVTATTHFDVSVNDLTKDDRIVFGNMEDYSFDRQFDVIVAGDIIEHVNNQGLFLQNVHRHLRNEGIFIVTTPNSKWITGFFKPNVTHNLWHDKYTLSRVLTMNGFRLDRFLFYYGNKRNYSWWQRILALRQGMIAICVKA